jgi:hypothetical protein
MGVREICFEINGASGPNMTQVVKPVSKYRKQASSAFQLPLRREEIKRLIGISKKKRYRAGRSADLRSARVGSVALLTQQRASVLAAEDATDVPRMEARRDSNRVNDLAQDRPLPIPTAALSVHQ